jgi:endoglucanase
VYSSRRSNHLLFDRRRCGHAARSNIVADKQPRLIPVRVHTRGAGGGAVHSQPAGIRCGGDCAHSYKAGATVSLEALPESNANFTGWGGACSGAARTCTTTVRRSTRVTAFFDPASAFSLSVAKDGGGKGKVTSKPAGINCGADCWQAYRAGTAVTLTAAASVGSKFAGWSGACSGSASCTVTMDRVRTVTATFLRRTGRETTGRVALPSYLTGAGATPPAAL